MKKVFKVISAVFILCFLFSCGGPESYKTPIVNIGDIVQGECVSAGKGELVEESFSANVVNGDILVEHLNILVPESTMMGIIDTDGNSSLDGKFNYYYLEASEQFISVREVFRRSSSEVNCYYDLRIKISNVSGGIYDLMLFNETGKLKYSKEVRVR
ncbi:MAG TPA: hypothetical protein VLJ60_03210 [bacterium]|nr:hypothetical protein [bacterium]